MIQIHIDFRSGITITNQIFEQIYEKVIRGELKPSDQLPTVRRLAKELKVNFNTVARAYRMLDQAGVISTQQGRGTYILSVNDPLMREKMEKLDAQTGQLLKEADKLEMTPGEVLAIFHRNFQRWEAVHQEKTISKKEAQ